MKKLFVLLLVAIAGSAMAQSSYYHRVGDTVCGRSPIYHYDWWPTLNASNHSDSILFTITGGAVGGYMKHTTNTPLRVIGVASTVARMYTGTATLYEDLDTTIDPAMDYVLFDATPGGLVEKARVCWTEDYMTHPKRSMELPITTGLCNLKEDTTAIVSLREYYFDSAITVTDSFYLGCDFKDISINSSDPNAFEAFLYYTNHAWSHTAYVSSDNANLKPCAINMPEFTYYDSSGLDNSWHYYTRKEFQLIFPIIEVDTIPQPDTIWRTVTALSANDSLGEVTGGGVYPDSSWVTITANPFELDCIGCHIEFDRWNDGDTTNPRHIFVTSDTTFTAIFRMVVDSTESIDEPSIVNSHFSIYPNPASMSVTIETDQSSTLTLTDATGRECGRWKVESGKTTLDISHLPASVYFVHLSASPTIRKLIIR